MAYRDEVYFEAPVEPEVSFGEDEFAGRLERIRAAMAGAGIDCLFLTSPESLYYVKRYHVNAARAWVYVRFVMN